MTNTLKELLIGKRVRATRDCAPIKNGEIHEIKMWGDRLYIGKNWEGRCVCADSWELVDPISFEPPKHECKFICQCGQEFGGNKLTK